MANKADLKRRITSIENTKKITKAMKLVAASKFTKAVQSVTNARPFSSAFKEMVKELIDNNTDDLSSPFLRANKEKKVLVVVVSTDKGLCGSINTNLFKFTKSFIRKKKEEGIEVDLMCWGRKSISFFKKENVNVISTREGILDKISYESASSYVNDFCSKFEEGSYDSVYVTYCEFKSALQQTPKLEKVLPVSLETEEEQSKEKEEQVKRVGRYIVEPSLPQIIDKLITKKISVTMFQILLEAYASEQGSKMTSMDNATNNATDLLKKLVLQYNRARQGAITTELIEIVAGSQAL